MKYNIGSSVVLFVSVLSLLAFTSCSTGPDTVITTDLNNIDTAAETRAVTEENAPEIIQAVTDTDSEYTDTEVKTSFFSYAGYVTDDRTRFRSYPDNSFDNVIAEIPEGEKITFLVRQAYVPAEDEDDKSWCLVDYKGQSGYVYADSVRFSNEKVMLSERQLISMAKQRLYDYMVSFTWAYSNCLSLGQRDFSVTDENGEAGRELYDITSKEDIYKAVNKYFSERYETFIRYGMESSLYDYIENYYFEQNGKWYVSDVIWNKGAMNLEVLSPVRLENISLEITDRTDDELKFSGKIDYGDMFESETIDRFSVIFEDDVWKCGSLSISR